MLLKIKPSAYNQSRKTATQYIDRKINAIVIIIRTCCINNSTVIHTTIQPQVLNKIFDQSNFIQLHGLLPKETDALLYQEENNIVGEI